MLLNILERFRIARQLSRSKHMEGEGAKVGTLRAGSSGVFTEQGEVAGSCVRKSHLRSLGIEADPPTNDKYIMFELGYANEDEIYKQMQSTLSEGEVILREDEIPVEWYTSNGTKVTGRPDMVICRWGEKLPNGNTLVKQVPILGLELKSVHSLWTARDVVFSSKPKIANLIQAAHYMWKLNIPYKIVYKSYSQLGQGMAGNEWIIKQFPRPGEPGSEFVEYSTRESKKTGQVVSTIKHIKQFEIVYDLKLDAHGRVHYKLEQEDIWTPSLVTTGDIERYFEYASKYPENANRDKLGPRPTAVDTLGNKANYSDCDYCPLKKVCDNADKTNQTYEQWLDSVKRELD